MKEKIKVIAIFMIIAMVSVNLVYATGGNDWWGQANNFWNGQMDTNAQLSINILGPITGLIKLVGNMIFVGVTVILGVKYIWGAAESKASVKDSMVTLVIAALVFYGWDTISSIFMNSDTNNLFFITGNVEVTAQKVFQTIMYVCNFLAVGGIVFVGVKYLLAGAEGKAQLKVQSVPVILGLVMVYATITFLNLIVSVL